MRASDMNPEATLKKWRLPQGHRRAAPRGMFASIRLGSPSGFISLAMSTSPEMRAEVEWAT